MVVKSSLWGEGMNTKWVTASVSGLWDWVILHGCYTCTKNPRTIHQKKCNLPYVSLKNKIKVYNFDEIIIIS